MEGEGVALAWTCALLVRLEPSEAPRRERMVRGELKALARAHGVTKSTMWERLNPERIDRAKKAERARLWRESEMRPVWHEYCAAYRERWAVGAPIGFGRFLSEKHYKGWLSAPEQLLALPNMRTLGGAREKIMANLFP